MKIRRIYALLMILILTVSGSLPAGMTAFPVMAAETDGEETDDSGEEVITEEEREVYPRTDTQGEEAESPEGEAVADEDPDIVEEPAYDPDDPMVLRIAENYGVSAEEVEEMVRNGEIGVGSASELLAGLKGNGLSHDGRFAKCTKRWGIDVSYWNGSNIGKTINWTKVREAGCEFAIIRCGYTNLNRFNLHTDNDFSTFIKAAKKAGIKVGVYFFSQATTTEEAVKEAEYAIKAVKNAGVSLDLPFYMDVEYGSGSRLKSAKLSKAAQTKVITAFCDKVEKAGYRAGIYASKFFYYEQMDYTALAKKYVIWMAHYASKTDYKGEYTMWQHSSTGSVSGISGNVDLNVWYDCGSFSANSSTFKGAARIAGAYTVAGGTYTIASSLDEGMVLQASKGGQLTLAKATGKANQKFKIKYLDGGYYVLTCSGTGQNMAAGGAKVQDAASNNSSAIQQWVIRSTKDGYYTIQSASGGKAVTCAGGSSSAGTRMQLEVAKSAGNQKFRFTLTDESPAIKNGIYTIQSAMDTGYVLDIAGGRVESGTNLQLYKSNGSGAQKFIVRHVGSGRYVIISCKSGKALDVKGAGAASGTNVHQYDLKHNAAQKWIIHSDGAGGYYLISDVYGNYLSVESGKAANQQNLCVQAPTGAKKMHFKFVKASAPYSVTGTRTIAAAGNSKMVVEVYKGSKADKANIQLYKSSGGSAQKFKITLGGDGLYTIQNVYTGKVLEVKGGSREEDANIQQYTSNGGLAQKWIIRKNKDKTYTFINAWTGKAMQTNDKTEAGKKLSNKTNICQGKDDQGSNQKFLIR